MAALPYMQLYIADYLADTMHLSTEEHGAYLLLMFNYWQTGRAIPKNRLAKIARVSSERWGAVEESLREFFTDNGTEWVHKRIEDDLALVRETLAKRSAAGKASVQSRRNRKETQSASESNTCSTGVDSVFEQESNTKPTNKDTDKNTDLKDLTQPKPFPSGRDFRDYVAGVLEGKLSGDSASEFHDSAIAKLQTAGLDVYRDYPVPERGDGCEGRIDIVVIDGNGIRCGIELDRNSPRQKSLFKLGAVELGICVLRRSDIVRRTEQDVLIIGGAEPAKKNRDEKFNPLNVELPDWLPAPLWAEWVEFRRALGKPVKTPQGATGLIRKLDEYRRQGFSPGVVISHSIANEYRGLFAPDAGACIPPGGNRGRDSPARIQELSPPDNTIPPGFKG
ncbi:YdaU family protein [Salmonella enterica]|nr:DUF1376 domain-containing protein [Salmonella enterica subsp. enterica serovar Newport]EBP1500055.1 DUF1376 domain-containing protein [Salmonella enterica]ECJ2405080.1 DUF1376 domain-containing protein [Salmonella enterica subsp. diarizonae]EDU5554675.1 YdaU family protein [Salmonella enterica subsp. diarizonae]EJA5988501.1 YdaU family protein [Salmonella enterica]